jgi:hypothetical protein
MTEDVRYRRVRAGRPVWSARGDPLGQGTGTTPHTHRLGEIEELLRKSKGEISGKKSKK